MKYIKKLTLIFLFATIGVVQLNAQVGFGADLVSRYVWRGSDFGQSPAIQPSLSYSNSGFEIGTWGSYQISRSASIAMADEADLYAGYTFDIGESNTLGLIVTDYYFPNAGVKFFNYNKHDNPDGGGAHTVEAGISYSGSGSFPITLSAYANVFSGSDPDNTMYFEVSYATSVDNVDINVFAGATPGGDSGYYGTKKFNVVNIGITASKEIKITEDFSLPTFGSFILNPYTETTYIVFGLSL